MMKKLIIFDFDGVIADSFEYCLKINKILNKEITAQEYRSNFYGNFYKDFEVNKKKADVKKIYSAYWEEFEKNLHEISLFSGMYEILSTLAKEYNVAIVSSCKDEILEKIMEKENIKHFFQAVYGSSYHQSKVEKFKHVLRDFKTENKNAIFITDTLGDLHEAESAGLESIAVSWGFHDVVTLEKGKSKIIIHKPEELLSEIITHFKDLSMETTN